MKAITLTKDLGDYLRNHSGPRNSVLESLEKETQARSDGIMQISPDQGRFLTLMTQVVNPDLALEIGCFTGYSAISIGQGLTGRGRLISLDMNDETGKIARSYFEKAELQDRVELRLGPALDSLNALEKEFGQESFGLAFIDADKVNYSNYFDACFKLLKPGGVMLFDNVLWNGSVADATVQDESTNAIRALNEKIKKDSRVDAVMLHIADGIYLARKEES